MSSKLIKSLNNLQTDYNCYLYNESSKIPGILHLNSECISFKVFGFEKTNLNLKIDYSTISNLSTYKLFNLETEGISIHDVNGTETVFILDEHAKLYKQLKVMMQKK